MNRRARPRRPAQGLEAGRDTATARAPRAALPCGARGTPAPSHRPSPPRLRAAPRGDPAAGDALALRAPARAGGTAGDARAAPPCCTPSTPSGQPRAAGLGGGEQYRVLRHLVEEKRAGKACVLVAVSPQGGGRQDHDLDQSRGRARAGPHRGVSSSTPICAGPRCHARGRQRRGAGPDRRHPGHRAHRWARSSSAGRSSTCRSCPRAGDADAVRAAELAALAELRTPRAGASTNIVLDTPPVCAFPDCRVLGSSWTASSGGGAHRTQRGLLEEASTSWSPPRSSASSSTRPIVRSRATTTRTATGARPRTEPPQPLDAEKERMMAAALALFETSALALVVGTLIALSSPTRSRDSSTWAPRGQGGGPVALLRRELLLHDLTTGGS